MQEERRQISVPSTGTVSSIWTQPDDAWDGRVFVYAPGSGSSLTDPFGAFLAERLASDRVACLRFQFPYTEAGRSLPDRNPVLEATWLAVLHAVQEPGRQVVAGGRSMGGRIASQVAAQGAVVSGLALFAYPLHPPGRPDKMRDAHLASISVPILFCSGTRDAFATPAELTAAAAAVPQASVRFLDGADHGFNVAKATGRSRADVWQEACDAFAAFLATLPSPRSGPRATG